MSHTLNVTYNNTPCYDIMIESDFNRLYNELKDWQLNNRKICIVSETNVAPYYLEELEANLTKIASKVCHVIFKAGEPQKNMDTISDIYEFLITEHFDRNDILIALGGGVTGDMTGYTAATYLRGISYIQIPTSLLSQVDSSIGGKTGVDFKCYKNMVGAFKQPKLVYINTTTLNSLPLREYLSGMGEIIKHGYIKNAAYLSWLTEHAEEIINRNQLIVEEMIYESCKVKQDVVQRDPLEKGERAILNFGHTLGHAIEKCMNFTLLHGECVALGMCTSLYLSYKKGNISEFEYKEGIDIMKLFSLPVKLSENVSRKDIIETTLLDKKMDSNVIKFIILERIGNAVIDRTITREDMYEALDTLF